MNITSGSGTQVNAYAGTNLYSRPAGTSSERLSQSTLHAPPPAPQMYGAYTPEIINRMDNAQFFQLVCAHPENITRDIVQNLYPEKIRYLNSDPARLSILKQRHPPLYFWVDKDLPIGKKSASKLKAALMTGRKIRSKIYSSIDNPVYQREVMDMFLKDVMYIPANAPGWAKMFDFIITGKGLKTRLMKLFSVEKLMKPLVAKGIIRDPEKLFLDMAFSDTNGFGQGARYKDDVAQLRSILIGLLEMKIGIMDKLR